MSYEAALKEEATPAEAVAKPGKPLKQYPQWNEDGTRKLNEDGTEAWGPTKMNKPKAPKPPKEPKAPKAPKEPEYQKGEDGEFLLDEEGNKIPVVKVRAAPVRRVPSSEASIITIDEEQAKRIAGYKGARAQYAQPLRDGQTLGDYLHAGGDRGFLRFYIRDGACSVKPPETAAA